MAYEVDHPDDQPKLSLEPMGCRAITGWAVSSLSKMESVRINNCQGQSCFMSVILYGRGKH